MHGEICLYCLVLWTCNFRSNAQRFLWDLFRSVCGRLHMYVLNKLSFLCVGCFWQSRHRIIVYKRTHVTLVCIKHNLKSQVPDSSWPVYGTCTVKRAVGLPMKYRELGIWPFFMTFCNVSLSLNIFPANICIKPSSSLVTSPTRDGGFKMYEQNFSAAERCEHVALLALESEMRKADLLWRVNFLHRSLNNCVSAMRMFFVNGHILFISVMFSYSGCLH